MLTPISRAVALTGLALLTAIPAQAQPVRHDEAQRHVLLISVDGLHASDVAQFTADAPDSTLARLQRGGTTFSAAFASQPSDSFPGLLAMVTGGTPKTTGVFYDDSYARDMWAAGSNCTEPPGAEMMYFENLDVTDPITGNIPRFTKIDPSKLPKGMVNGHCVPVNPHSFLQTNTIFNIANAAKLYTAWSDKHPAYDIVNGPSGLGVQDLYTPEINTTVDDPTTISVGATDAYDQLKVKAILNEIDGFTSTRSKPAPVPAIFGMNFQSVSVGEKLVDPVLSCKRNPPPSTTKCDPNYVPGGYEPGSLKFTPQMMKAMTYVDGALGSMVHELEKNDLLDTTEIIVSAKHGQSPIDPAQLHKIGDPISPILGASAIAQMTTDDIALIWLTDQTKTAAAVKALLADKAGANTALIDYVLSGAALADKFGDPLKNARTPDLIVQPKVGTIYTGSKAKVAEHGGFSENDTHVALIVFNGAGRGGEDRSAVRASESDSEGTGRTISTPVHTTQIAPSILQFLGLDPEALNSVRLEGTRPLPR